MVARLIILIAPNVSEQMGGEAIKALLIFREIKKQRPNTIQITHARCRDELAGRLNLSDVHFIGDTQLSVFLWKSRVLRGFLDIWFAVKAVRLAEKLAAERGLSGNDVIIHQTEPNSPVTPRVVSAHHSNVFGPINGNIYYPPSFRSDESLSARLRRLLHFPAQAINRYCFHGKSWADAILCAGGARTRRSLLAAGYPTEATFDSLDCGVSDEIIDRPRAEHKERNLKFVHFGRLVFHKGTALAIQSLTQTKTPATLDIIGRGPELERCKGIVDKLGLNDRVQFLDWMPSHNDLLNSLSAYRGMILPSLEDANGIVVQEAMALGLPAICLDWGGPQLLIEDGISGFLIDPASKDGIISEIAARLDMLSNDPDVADSVSAAAKQRAQQWRWSTLVRSWVAMYEAIHSPLYR